MKHSLQDHPFGETIIVIGASTGGPAALEETFTQLPGELPGIVLVVQHMPAGFTKSLAERLDKLVHFHVKEPEHLEVIRSNTAYIAPGGCHMRIRVRNTGLVIDLSRDEPIQGHRPSVDSLLYSVAEINNARKIAVILTGMGRDGAAGIQKLKSTDPNALVVAEARDTAIIYGMPKAAVLTQSVDYELPLPQIGRTITNMLHE
jgi:two-component system chemotaxis response regulator CheB